MNSIKNNGMNNFFTSKIRLLFFFDMKNTTFKLDDISKSSNKTKLIEETQNLSVQSIETINTNNSTDKEKSTSKKSFSNTLIMPKFSNENKNLKVFKSIEEKSSSETSDFLKKKRNPLTHIKEEEKKEGEDDYKNKNINENVKIISKKMGRKKKELKQNDKSIYLNSHSKFSEDNVIKKIKANIFKSIIKWLNEICQKEIKQTEEENPSQPQTQTQTEIQTQTEMQIEAPISMGNLENLFFEKESEETFLKLDFKGVINNISRKYNIEMMNKTIGEIFSNNINKRYKKKKKEHNAKLIKKILKENKYKNVIGILKLTFKEVLEIFTEKAGDDIKNKINQETLDKFNKIDKFLEIIKEQEIKNKEMNGLLIDIYTKNVENLCLNYEKWFNNRNIKREQKKIKEINESKEINEL